MTIQLANPPHSSVELTLLTNRIEQKTPFANATTLVSRLGDHYSYKLDLKLRGDQGSGYIAKLDAGRGGKVRVQVRQPFTVPVIPRAKVATLVSGGTNLNVSGLPASHQIKSGQLLSLISATGKWYLHRVVDGVTASTGGTVSLTLVPAIRADFAVGNDVEVSTPQIEGFVVEKTTPARVGFVDSVSISFTVEEAE